MRHVRRNGGYLRVADPNWANLLDGSYAMRSGGRWNAPGSFPVIYLNRDVRVARANVARNFRGLPYGPELLRPEEAPVLVHTTVPDDDYVDIVTDNGCLAAGLPRTYPVDGDGTLVPWDRCQPIGARAWQEGEAGIACRSAAPGAPADGEELACFCRTDDAPLREEGRLRFDEWFW